MDDRTALPGALAAAAASVSFGASVAATRFVIVQTDPLTLAFLRYLIASAVMVPLVLALRRAAPPARDLLPIAVLGVLHFGVFPWTFSAGLQYTLASRGALILGSTPLQTLLLAAACRIERFTWPKLAGTLLALAGLALALGGQALGSALPADVWKGDLLMLLTGFLGAVYAVFSRPYLRRTPALAFTGWSMLAGLAFLALVSAAGGRLAAAPAFTAAGWAAVLFIGLIGGALGFFLWVWALERTSPTRVVVFVTLNPLAATVLGVLLLGEPVGLRFAAGLALVLAGIVVTTRRARAAAPRAAGADG